MRAGHPIDFYWFIAAGEVIRTSFHSEPSSFPPSPHTRKEIMPRVQYFLVCTNGVVRCLCGLVQVRLVPATTGGNAAASEDMAAAAEEDGEWSEDDSQDEEGDGPREGCGLR